MIAMSAAEKQGGQAIFSLPPIRHRYSPRLATS